MTRNGYFSIKQWLASNFSCRSSLGTYTSMYIATSVLPVYGCMIRTFVFGALD